MFKIIKICTTNIKYIWYGALTFLSAYLFRRNQVLKEENASQKVVIKIKNKIISVLENPETKDTDFDGNVSRLLRSKN